MSGHYIAEKAYWQRALESGPYEKYALDWVNWELANRSAKGWNHLLQSLCYASVLRPKFQTDMFCLLRKSACSFCSRGSQNAVTRNLFASTCSQRARADDQRGRNLVPPCFFTNVLAKSL